MRYLNKIIFLNSAHIPFSEVKLDGNVHFTGTQGVGKSTLLRALLFFYNADKTKLGIANEKKNFDSFYLPFSNSYIVYEVMRENGPYSVIVTKSMGRAAFRFVDGAFNKDWFINMSNEVFSDWSDIRKRIADSNYSISSLVTDYYMFRDIIFGNNKRPDLISFRKYAVVESAKYQNIPRTIQNVFLNSKLDADFIKNTIIQSMNDDDILINMMYYRSQTEAFEQEYSDVMLWFKKNKNGEIVVRKQADCVINYYRKLLFQKRQIQEGREELNYAEKSAIKRTPILRDEIKEDNQEIETTKRFISEENNKYNSERDKLVRLDGSIIDDLKKIKKKREYYQANNINEVISRVRKEDSLINDLKSNTQLFNDLTSANKDVTQKYELMMERLDTDSKTFANEKRKQILNRKESFGEQKNKLLIKLQNEERNIRDNYDEKFRIFNESKIKFVEEIASIKQSIASTKMSSHYKKEIEECKSRLDLLCAEKESIILDIEKKKIDCEHLRQDCSSKLNEISWKYKTILDDYNNEKRILNDEITKLCEIIENHKGSFCDWLNNNISGWQQTIGKVVDEQVLFNHKLAPKSIDDNNLSFYGVKLELSEIERETISIEELTRQLNDKKSQKDDITRKIDIQLKEQEAESELLKNKYNSKIREISDEQHMLEAKSQLIPTKISICKADLTTWNRKESSWRDEHLTLLNNKLEEVTSNKSKLDSNYNALKENRDKEIKKVLELCKKEEKLLQTEMDNDIKIINDEISANITDIENKKLQLRKTLNNELSGKGIDKSLIENYQMKIDLIRKEIIYINEKRSLVSDFDKDKREYFDRESQLRNNKCQNDASINNLDEKYKLRREKLIEKLKKSESLRDIKNNELKEILDDLEKLKNFKADISFSPPIAYTVNEKNTKKSCGNIIEELKSMIISEGKDIDSLKKAINLFNSNFTLKNTFGFPLSLVGESDYFDFASNLCEFIDNEKIKEYQSRISERYISIIKRISKEVGDLTQNESEIQKTIKAINNDFIEKNFTGVIRNIELRSLPSNDKLMQLILEIKDFNEQNLFNMGEVDLFSQESRTEVNEKAVKYLITFSKMLKDEPNRQNIKLSDTFNLQFRVVENDNDTGWIEKIANVGSDGTDILVKAMVNIMLINVFKAKASRKFGDFKIHCMMDEIGKLHPNNIKGILAFANCRNILLVNSSPISYNWIDYRYTYLLKKDSQSNTSIVPLLIRK